MEIDISILITIFAGVTFMGFGIKLLVDDRHIKKTGTKTLATVIDLKEEKDQDSTTYRQVLEFTTKKGETVVQELDFSSSIKPKKTPPFKTPIFYLIEEGELKIVLAKSKTKTFIGIGFIFLGAVPSAFGISKLFDLILLSN